MTTDTVFAGFDAFGHPVPWARKSSALAHLREMVPDATLEQMTQLIDVVAECIERDDPYNALANATHAATPVSACSPQFGTPPNIITELHLDVTGGYRLLAALCTDGPNDS